jgi:hypothetical protein
VVEARKLSDSIQEKAVGNKNNEDNIEHNEIVQSLDAMGYDEAAQYVYGMMYPEWKKRHAQKASDEKMEQFNNSKSLWATHDKQLLTKRGEIPPASSPSQPSVHTTNSNNNICKAPTTVKATATSLLSNVCCEDIDNNNSNITSSSEQQQQSSSMQQVNNNVNTTSSFVLQYHPIFHFLWVY